MGPHDRGPKIALEPRMTSKTHDLHDKRLADAWATLQAHSDKGLPLDRDPSRLAFADPEFLLRRETRGLRMQLELMKPDLQMREHGIENTVVVFGSARFRSEEESRALIAQAEAAGDTVATERWRKLARNSHYYEQARAFGKMVAQYSNDKEPEDKLFICTGGGPGIMQAANRGSYEGGGLNIGLAIALPMEEEPNPYVTPALSFKFHYFAIRKMHFMMRAKALVAFPGGFGTMDELFEILTLGQTGKMPTTPVVLFDRDYWTKAVNFRHFVDHGMISERDLALFGYADSAEEAWAALLRMGLRISTCDANAP